MLCLKIIEILKNPPVFFNFKSDLGYSILLTLVEKTWKKGISLLGTFVILREKRKKYIREICHHGGKSCPDCREINIFFPGPFFW